MTIRALEWTSGLSQSSIHSSLMCAGTSPFHSFVCFCACDQGGRLLAFEKTFFAIFSSSVDAGILKLMWNRGVDRAAMSRWYSVLSKFLPRTNYALDLEPAHQLATIERSPFLAPSVIPILINKYVTANTSRPCPESVPWKDNFTNPEHTERPLIVKVTIFSP